MNWTNVLIVTAASLPGIAVALPPLIDSLARRVRASPGAAGKPLPPRRVLIAVGVVQSTLLAAVAAIAGAAIGPGVGLGRIATDAFTAPGGALEALTFAVTGSAVMLGASYGIFRPRLDVHTRTVSENVRRDLGLASRVLYGGVVEEVLLRWGVLSVLFWLLSHVLGTDSGAFWTANAVAGVLFAVGHWPAYLAAGCRRTPAFFSTSLILNTFLAMLDGWMLWRYGLAGAVLGHVVTHLLWYPLERAVWQREDATVTIT